MTNGVVTIWNALVKKLPTYRFFRVLVWEQRRWNQWGPATRVEGTDVVWTGGCPTSAVVFGLAVCHILQSLEKRSGVPDDPDCERASGGGRRTPMRKKIHPHCRSSLSRHQSRMWVIAVWDLRHGADIDDGSMRGVGWDGWRPGGG